MNVSFIDECVYYPKSYAEIKMIDNSYIALKSSQFSIFMEGPPIWWMKQDQHFLSCQLHGLKTMKPKIKWNLKSKCYSFSRQNGKNHLEWFYVILERRQCPCFSTNSFPSRMYHTFAQNVGVIDFRFEHIP